MIWFFSSGDWEIKSAKIELNLNVAKTLHHFFRFYSKLELISREDQDLQIKDDN